MSTTLISNLNSEKEKSFADEFIHKQEIKKMWIVEICRIVSLIWIFDLVDYYAYEFITCVRTFFYSVESQLTINIIMAKTFFRDFTIQEWTCFIVIIIIFGLMIYYLWGDNKYERHYYENNMTFFLILRIIRFYLLLICFACIIKYLYIIIAHIFVKFWVLHQKNERLKLKNKIYQRK
jgi:hypothetical protein